VQRAGHINLIEGSTGAGGLDNLNRSNARPPIEFSIQSVAVNCQFTRVQRFSITSTDLAAPADSQQFGDDVTASTLYFRPQAVAPGRTCGTGTGISAPTIVSALPTRAGAAKDDSAPPVTPSRSTSVPASPTG
jgi:hypothetical protein